MRRRLTAAAPAAAACALLAAALHLAPFAARAQVREPSRIGVWRLDETSGTTARDGWGGNPGTHTAGVSVGTPRLTLGSSPGSPEVSYSARYDGTGGRTVINSSAALNPTGALAIEAWIYPDALAPTSATTNTIIRKDAQYLLRVLSNGSLVFRVWVGGAAQEATTPAGTIAARKIYHVVATYDGSSQVVYLNGVAKVTRAQAGAVSVSSNPLLFGASSSGGIYDFFAGRIDEVVLYSTAPSATWVANRYNSMADKTQPDTAITSAPPASTTETAAAFGFSSTEAGSTFNCSLDGGAYAACTSPKSYAGLSLGSHTFGVRAVDPVGNVDSTPAGYSWSVAAQPTCYPSFGSFGVGSWPPGCWRPYADASPFNQPIPASPAVASNSAQIIATINGWTEASGKTGPQDMYAGAADTVHDYYHPFYYSQPADPLYTIHCTEAWGTCEVEGMTVRIPASARPAGGGDRHMTVVDQQNFWEYDFWKVEPRPAGGGTLNIAWGGRTRIGTADSDGLNSDATAAHFGLLAGIIRAQELEAGQINHALVIFVKCTNNVPVYPAAPNGKAAPCADTANAPAEGQRLQLNLTDAEIGALKEPAWKKTVLRAMARYGMYVGDTGGATWSPMFESGSSYTSFGYADPMVTFAQNHQGEGGIIIWDNRYWFDLRNTFDANGVSLWNRLRVIAPPCDYNLNNCPPPSP
jgi:hypothetical protein